MAKKKVQKKRPPRHGSIKENLPVRDEPIYLQLLNQKEIQEFKFAFPNMEDFITPDGKVALPVTPSIRARAVYAYHSLEVAQDYLFRIVNKFKMRGMSYEQMGQLFDVTPQTICRWIAKLKQRYITASKQVEIQTLVGETLEYFSEIGATAMREMDAATKPADKSRLLETALRSKESTITFLEKAGFFVNNQMTADDSQDKGRKAAVDVGNAIVSLLEGKSVEEFAYEVMGDANPDIDALKEKYKDVVS